MRSCDTALMLRCVVTACHCSLTMKACGMHPTYTAPCVSILSVAGVKAALLFEPCSVLFGDHHEGGGTFVACSKGRSCGLYHT